MKKALFSSLLFLAAFPVLAQSYTFAPNWQKGDMRTKYVTTTEVEYEGDQKIEDVTEEEPSASIKVLSVQKDYYEVEMLYKNVGLEAAIEMFEMLDDEMAMKEYKNLRMIFHVSKDGRTNELQNWEEARDFMDHGINLMKQKITEEDADAGAMVDMLFAPVKQLFSNKEAMEGTFETEMLAILLPYQSDYEVGKPVTITETTDNPFQPGTEISMSTTTTLKSVDKTAGTATFTMSIAFDTREFIKMMKGMMGAMFEGIGDEEMRKAKLAELDNMKMDMTNELTVTYDMNSTWSTAATGASTVVATMPGEGSKRKESLTKIRID